MKKVLLYDNKIYLNARSFYEYVLDEGIKDGSWDLPHVSVAHSNRYKTISGIAVDWVSVDKDTIIKLEESDYGFIDHDGSLDPTFLEYVVSKETPYTREILWSWVVEYSQTYESPLARMKRLVDDVMAESKQVDKKNNVFLYEVVLDDL